MRRRLLLTLLALGTTLPSPAAQRVTVAQFEQAVASLHGKADDDAAFRIADHQLTERLSPARVSRLIAGLPGEKSRQALIAIADASQFQPPPGEEIPPAATPDVREQRRIMGLVVAYVTKSIPQLPNFIATRTTERFEDTPQAMRSDLSSMLYEPLHFVGQSHVTVAYRENREVEEPALPAKEQPTAESGLSSRGEFGSLLSTILLDAAQNRLGWLRWEKGESGPLAAFAYSVAKEKSHFVVDFCCVPDSEGTSHPYREVAGYTGNMLVDPATGTILRLEVVADLKPAGPIRIAKIVVEYGPVDIGGRTYICPLHSIAFSRAHAIAHEQQEMVPMAPRTQGGGMAPVVVGTAPTNSEQTLLNDVTFAQYHVFRAETRVIAGTSADQPPLAPPTTQSPAQDSPSVQPKPDIASSAAVSTPETAPPPQPKAPEVSSAVPATAAGSSLASTTPEQPPTPEIKAAPEISLSDRAELPDAPAKQEPPSPGSGFRLRTTTRLVDVGIVAYDKKGHPVTDLKQSDFELYDNGRRQEIKFFGQASTSAEPSPAMPQASPTGLVPEPFYSNRQAVPALERRPAAPENHATILLIDAANLAWPDLQYARKEMLRFLKTVAPDEPVGLYILRSSGFQILLEPTTDHVQIAKTLTGWMPDAQDLQRAQDEERLNRQQLDYVRRKEDLTRVNGHTDTTDPDGGTTSLDPQLRDWGRTPGQDALSLLNGVARHLAAIAGHKNLVWVTSDNVLADWSGRSVTIEKGSTSIEPFTLHAQEAMNDAHVSVYPLDASQLEGGAIAADIQNRNVEVSPTAPMLPSPGSTSPGNSIQTPGGEDVPTGRDSKPGRITAAMQQDLHPIQGPIRQLAEATGGRALRRAGDIAGELNGIAEDGRAAYLLSFTPDGAADDKYHLIAVKLAGRRDIKLRYRTGYLYEKEPASPKERFRQAIWQAQDVNDIALTATPANTAGINLNIAASDLGIAQANDRWIDKLDIFLVERDDAALRAKVTGRSLVLRLLPATYQKVLREGIPVEQPLPDKTAAGSLRIVVVDENSGRMGSVTIPVSALKR